MKPIALFFLCCLMKVALANELPDLGDASQSVLSAQQERQIGEQGMLEIRASKSYLDDAEINDYLNRLGYRLVANSQDPAQAFEFFALNENQINAFAMPGGFVGVNTGLITTAQNESELASVLAHEISHVTQHHLARLIASQKADSLTAMAALAIAILAARNNPNAAVGAIAGAGAASTQRQLNFTREHEEEADRIGLTTLQKSGFDVRAMPIFFERLQQGTRLLDNNNAPSWMRTHPVTSERIADIDSRVNQLPVKLVADSLDFQLVRTKLLFMSKTPQDAIAYFSDALGAKKYGDPVVQRYGLALALLENGDVQRAADELALLHKQPRTSAMIETLAGKVHTAQHMPAAQLIRFYRNAVKTYPQHRALAYDYARLLVDSRQYDDALKLLDAEISTYSNDANLYELQAHIFAAQHRPQEEHHALAYAYISEGNLKGAIEQLELARRSGNNYYEQSIIDSELRQFREIAAAHSKKR